MSLTDVQHVEVVAIVRRMLDARTAGVDPDAWVAAEQWLAENHPKPSVYVGALKQAARPYDHDPPPPHPGEPNTTVLCFNGRHDNCVNPGCECPCHKAAA